MKRKYLSIIFIALNFILVQATLAQTYTWQGCQPSGANDWQKKQNWSPFSGNSGPVSPEVVNVTTSSVTCPIVISSQTVTAGAITVSSQTVTISSGSVTSNTLTVSSAATYSVAAAGVSTQSVISVTGGTLTCGGTVNTSTLSVAGGYMVVASGATSTQTLTAVSSGTLDVSGTLTTNTLTISGGVVRINAGASFSAGAIVLSGGTLLVNGTINITGNVSVTTGTITSTDVTNGIVNFNGNSTLSSSGSVTFPNVVITSTKTLIHSGSSTIDVIGNFNLNGGTFTPGGGTINFVGSSAQKINGSSSTHSFNNIIINNASGVYAGGGGVGVGGLGLGGNGYINILNANDITLTAGNFTPPPTFNVSGNYTNNGGNFVCGTKTVVFNGAGAQAIAGTAASESFYNITVNKLAGTLTVGGGSLLTVTTNSITLATANAGNVEMVATATLNLTQTTSSSLVLSSGNTGTFYAGSLINVRGDWTNNCAANYFVPNTGLVKFVQNSTQFINGTSATHDFYDLEIDKGQNYVSTTGGSATKINAHNFTQTAYPFYISSLTTFSVSGNFIHTMGTFTPCNNIYIGGNIVENKAPGQLSWGNNVVLNGASLQTIGGTYTLPVFTNLEINNTGTAGVTLQKPVTVASGLTLTSGYVNTDATNLLVLNNDATSNMGNALSFVNGPMKKIGDDPFVFPVGKAGTWAPVAMVSDAAFLNFETTTEFTCTYYNTAPVNNDNKEYLSVGIEYASYVEYWDLSRTYDVGNNAQCNVRLYWMDTTYSGIDADSISDLMVVHYNSAAALFESQGGVAVSNGKSGYITSTIPLTSFSPLTFGSGSGANPLPIELLSFNAILNSANDVEIIWEVASEHNNSHFIIERSSDGVNFQELVRVAGAGNSLLQKTYSVIDDNPHKGISYYRLTQVDFDGTATRYNTANIYLNDDGEVYLFYPNPLYPHQTLFLRINAVAPKNIRIDIEDAAGKLVCTRNISLNKGFNQVRCTSVDCNLAPGFYTILVNDNGNIYTQKWVVK